MKRGEIWIVGGGVYSTKPRPALIIQDELFQPESSVTVLPLTTELRDAPLFRVRVAAGQDTGLRSDSDVMVDKITTIKRVHASQRIGRIAKSDLVALERILLAHLGIAR